MDNQVISFVQTNWIQIILTIIISYLVGSISFSIIITRWARENEDIRKLGSGNAGFTNVLRSVGKLPAILTLAGDFAKGIVAVLIGRLIFSGIATGYTNEWVIVNYGAYLAGFFCVIGHIYPCFFGFKGGKGILTTCAMIFMTDWRVACIVLGLFLVIVLITKIVSLGSIAAAFAYPIVTFLFKYFGEYLGNEGTVPFSYVISVTILSLIIGALALYKHRSNMKRILNGTEKKIKAHR